MRLIFRVNGSQPVWADGSNKRHNRPAAVTAEEVPLI